MKRIIFYILLLILIKSAFTQEIKVKVVFNNTNDLIAKSDFVTKINNELVCKKDLANSIIALKNFYAYLGENTLSDENLMVYIAFLDKDYFAGLKLIDKEELNFSNYITDWQEKYGKQSAVLFMFTKNGNDYAFNKLVASYQLEDQHLFIEVMNFINLNLSGSIENVIISGTQYLAKAIKPIWTQETMDNALVLTSESSYPEYHKGYCYGIYTYYDFEPYHYTWPMVGLPDENEKEYIRILSSYNYKKRVDNQIEKMMSCNYHHDINNASEWLWNEVGNLGVPNDNDNFHIKKSEDLNENGQVSHTVGENYCRLNMVGNTTRKGEELINFKYRQIWGYQPTWCNQLANDLSKNILINQIPWISVDYRASQIHDVIKNNNPLFKEVSFDEIWEYTNAGYVVYVTAYHSSGVKYNTDGSINYGSSSPGHIATGFPCKNSSNYKENFVVQAGGFGKTGKILFESAWVTQKYWTDNMIKAHVYLGYIKN